MTNQMIDQIIHFPIFYSWISWINYLIESVNSLSVQLNQKWNRYNNEINKQLTNDPVIQSSFPKSVRP